MKKLLGIFMIWVFLFDISSAALLAETKNSNLAPQLASTQKDVRDRIISGQIIFSHDAFNAYIADQIAKRIKAEGDGWIKELVEKDQPIPIHGLFARTGAFAQVGLGRRYGKAVIYIDADVFNNLRDRQEVLKHEYDEKQGWENLRELLGEAYGKDIAAGEMREWIINHIDKPDDLLKGTEYSRMTSRQIAGDIHSLSHPIGHLYKKYGSKIDVDSRLLFDLLARFDPSAKDESAIFYDEENSKDIPITAFTRSVPADNISLALQKGYWSALLNRLRIEIRAKYGLAQKITDLLNTCDKVVRKNNIAIVERNYPILKAVALLSPSDKKILGRFLKSRRGRNLRKINTVASAIALMLDPSDVAGWAGQHTPHLEGRDVFYISSEISQHTGGLGIVSQSHSFYMNRLLSTGSAKFATIEPDYYVEFNEATQKYDRRIDYEKLWWPGKDAKDISPEYRKREARRFELRVGNDTATAVVYRALDELGVARYTIKGFKRAIAALPDRDHQEELDKINPYYTNGLYRYKDAFKRDDYSTRDEFSEFFSAASAIFIDLLEEDKRSAKQDSLKMPVACYNDGQLGDAPFYTNVYKKVKNPVFVAYVTHTVKNRCANGNGVGEALLKWKEIPIQYWYLYEHRGEGFELVIDPTSAGVRSADWASGVSSAHVENIMARRWDNGWGLWSSINIKAIANGDVRSRTTEFFRKHMKQLFGGEADPDNPTAAQIRAVHRECKKYLNERFSLSNYGQAIDPELPLVSYTGRPVDEKASPYRAFSQQNIMHMLNKGYNIVMGFKSSGNPAIVKHFSELADNFNKKDYKGRLIVLCNIGLEDQRAILTATDLQIQDSEKDTEAAGYTESNAGACGALELAPPWKEGLLQAQGIKINFDRSGEGNTLIPKDSHPKSYTEIIDKLFDKGLDIVAQYQATAVKLSTILEAVNTSAAYLTEWDKAVAKKEARLNGRAPLPEERAREAKEPAFMKVPCPDREEITRLIRSISGKDDKGTFKELARLGYKDSSNLFAIFLGLTDNKSINAFLNAVRIDKQIPKEIKDAVKFYSRYFFINNARHPTSVVCQIPIVTISKPGEPPSEADEMLKRLDLPPGSYVYLLGSLRYGVISEKIAIDKREEEGPYKGLFVCDAKSIDGAVKIVVNDSGRPDRDEVNNGFRQGSPFSACDPFEINPGIGGEKALDILCDRLHSRGNMVILDMVGQFSPDSPIVIEHPEWMRGRLVRNEEESTSDIDLINNNPGHFLVIKKGGRERWLIAHNRDWFVPGAAWWTDTAAPDWSNKFLREYFIRAAEKWALTADGVRLDMAHLIPDSLRAEMLKRARVVNPRFVRIDEVYHEKEEESMLSGGISYAKYVCDWMKHSEVLSRLLQGYFRTDAKHLKDLLYFAGNHDDIVANLELGRVSQVIAATMGGHYLFYAPHILYGAGTHIPAQATYKRFAQEFKGKEDDARIREQALLMKTLAQPAFESAYRKVYSSTEPGILAYSAGRGYGQAIVVANISTAKASGTVIIDTLSMKNYPAYLLYDSMGEKFYICDSQKMNIELEKDEARIFFTKPIDKEVFDKLSGLTKEKSGKSFTLEEIRPFIANIDTKGPIAFLLNDNYANPFLIQRVEKESENALAAINYSSGISQNLKEGMVYEIRINKERLAELPYGLDIVDAYVKLLKARSPDPENVILKFSREAGLVSVQSYKSREEYNAARIFGEGSVGVKGEIKEKQLNLTALLNIAIAASNIRRDVTTEEGYNDYEKRLFLIIRDQYRQIYDKSLSIPDGEILYFIKDLPPIEKPLPIDLIELYYRLTYERLQQAA